MNRNQKSQKSHEQKYTREAVLASLKAALERTGIGGLIVENEPPEGFFPIDYYKDILNVSYNVAVRKMRKLERAGGAERKNIRVGGTMKAYYKIN